MACWFLLLMWKWMGLFLRKNHLLKCYGWLFLINWTGALTLPLFLNCLQENWTLNSFYKVSFSGGCSASFFNWHSLLQGQTTITRHGITRKRSTKRLNHTGSDLLIFDFDVKLDGSVFEVNSSFKMLGVTFSSKLDCSTYIISIAKTVSKKIGALIHSMMFHSPEGALYLLF